MAIHFTCIRCGKGLKVRDELAGSEGQCPHCKVAFRVPVASAAGEKANSADEGDFDPIAFLNEEPADTGRRATIPADLSVEEESVGTKARGKKGGAKASNKGGDEDGPPPINEWDQAMAAREMRNALKASVKQAKEKRESEGLGIQFELRDVLRDYGPTVIGSLLLLSVLVGGLYWLFDNMMGGTVSLPKLGYVSGTVTLNGEPLPGATVYFAPQEEVEFADTKRGDKPRTSFGVTDEKGRYTMMYMEDTAGVAVGKCRVWIEYLDPSGKLQVPGDFTQAAMQLREVVGGNQTIDFAMKQQKPGKK